MYVDGMHAIECRKWLECTDPPPHVIVACVFRVSHSSNDKHRPLPQEFHTGTNYHHTIVQDLSINVCLLLLDTGL